MFSEALEAFQASFVAAGMCNQPAVQLRVAVSALPNASYAWPIAWHFGEVGTPSHIPQCSILLQHVSAAPLGYSCVHWLPGLYYCSSALVLLL